MQLSFDVSIDNTKHEEAFKKVNAVKKKASLTLEEAWEQIFSRKNTSADLERLSRVQYAMEQGLIGREPEAVAKGKVFSKAEALRLFAILKESEREATLQEMVRSIPANFELVTSTRQLQQLCELAEYENLIAIDLETNGLNSFENDIVGFCVSLDKADQHYYIPVRHYNFLEMILKPSLVIQYLKDIFTRNHVHYVFHNASFDLKFLSAVGIEVGGFIHDTMVRMHVLNENEPSYRLKDLATKYLGSKSDNFGELFGKDCDFGTMELDIALAYAAKDTKLTLDLYKFQEQHLNSIGSLKEYYMKVEQPLINVVHKMEQVGFCLDLDEVASQEVYIVKELDELTIQLTEYFGDINFKSPAQLKRVIYEDLGLGIYLPPRADKATDVGTLKILAKYNEGCALLLRHRELSKQLSSFVQSLPKLVQVDGRVHGRFNQSGTVTGRFSATAPNFQQMSKPARKMFIAPEGQVILGADFSAQEPRILTSLTQEPFLLEVYKNNKDLYSMMATKIFNRPIEECGDGSIYRKQTKMIVLAILYGMSANALAEILGIQKKQAQLLMDEFFKQFTQVESWMEEMKKLARKQGYVEALFGRKRRLPAAKSRDKWERLRAERQIINSIIQGSASVQTKLTMMALYEYCLSKGDKWQLLASIHDEILLLVPEEITEHEVSEINNIMVGTVPLNNVSNKTDIEIGKCWGRMVSVREWFGKEDTQVKEEVTSLERVGVKEEVVENPKGDMQGEWDNYYATGSPDMRVRQQGEW